MPIIAAALPVPQCQGIVLRSRNHEEETWPVRNLAYRKASANSLYVKPDVVCFGATELEAAICEF